MTENRHAGKMFYIFIDNRVSDGVTRALTLRHAAVIRLPSFWRLPAPVAAHADMLLFRLESGELLTFREYYSLNAGVLDASGARFAFTDEIPGDTYPRDVLLDALPFRGTLFGHPTGTSRILKNGFSGFVPVRQGYARCSVASVGDGIFITSDDGIRRALEEKGADVLPVSPGGIQLPGYDTGFIGGAGTLLPDGEYLFFGDITAHPDVRKIEDFLISRGVRFSFIPGEALTDFGGAVCL